MVYSGVQTPPNLLLGLLYWVKPRFLAKKSFFLSREKTSGVEESAEEKASSPPRRNVLTYNEYLAKHYSERNTPGDIRYEFGIVRVSRAVVVDPKPFASDPGSEHN